MVVTMPGGVRVVNHVGRAEVLIHTQHGVKREVHECECRQPQADFSKNQTDLRERCVRECALRIGVNTSDRRRVERGCHANNHTQRGHVTTWETSVALYPDTYSDATPAANQPMTIKANQPIGFALAYCDNDGSPERENFMGSLPVAGADKNRGWIDASIFGTVLPVAAGGK